MDVPGAGMVDPAPEVQELRLGVIGGTQDLVAAIDSVGGLRVARHALPEGQDWRQVINPNRVDALLVDAPPPMRADMLQDAVAVGLPVLCRGAMATSPSDMAMLKRLAAMSGGMVMGWYPWLFEPAFAAIKELGGAVGPIRAISAFTTVPDALDDAALIWACGADAVATCLEIFGGKPTYQAAERAADGGIDLRLIFAGDVPVRIHLKAGTEATQGFAVHHDPVVMAWSAAGGLRIHPPSADVSGPQGAGEAVATPDAGGPVLAIRTFLHMVLDGEPQPQILDFAADLVEVLAACEGSL